MSDGASIGTQEQVAEAAVVTKPSADVRSDLHANARQDTPEQGTEEVTSMSWDHHRVRRLTAHRAAVKEIQEAIARAGEPSKSHAGASNEPPTRAGVSISTQINARLDVLEEGIREISNRMGRLEALLIARGSATESA